MAKKQNDTQQFRLDRYLSQSTGISRKVIHKILRDKLVTVNGEITKSASLSVSSVDTIIFDGEIIAAPAPRYFLYHKPKGLVCANKDRRYPTVIDEFEAEPRFQDLQCVGRLDIDTTGLLLVTDDGNWNHRISHPNHKCNKYYYADFEGTLPENAIEKCLQGIYLTKEKLRASPATLEPLSDHEANICIQEGRHHQVKRMFHALDCEVIELHRYKIGELCLENDFPVGEYRPLTVEEVALFTQDNTPSSTSTLPNDQPNV
jgi:16S rRNA pseudouridine516 synthase